MQDCGVGAAVFGWRWLLLYAARNTKISSRASLGDRRPDNYRSEGSVPELQKPKPVVLSSNLLLLAHYTSGQMVRPNMKGPSPTPSANMAATLLALQAPLPSSIYMFTPPPSLPYMPSRLSATTPLLLYTYHSP